VWKQTFVLYVQEMSWIGSWH